MYLKKLNKLIIILLCYVFQLLIFNLKIYKSMQIQNLLIFIKKLIKIQLFKLNNSKRE